MKKLSLEIEKKKSNVLSSFQMLLEQMNQMFQHNQKQNSKQNE